MERTDHVTQDGVPTEHLFSQDPAFALPASHLHQPDAAYRSAWNVSSPYAVPSLQDPVGPHGPSTYSYLAHSQTFSTQAPVTQASSTQYGSSFAAAYPSLDLHGYAPSLGPDAVGPAYPPPTEYGSQTSFAHPDFSYSGLPAFAEQTTTGVTVSPYALLNVSTQPRVDDQAQLNDGVSLGPWMMGSCKVERLYEHTEADASTA